MTGEGTAQLGMPELKGNTVHLSVEQQGSGLRPLPSHAHFVSYNAKIIMVKQAPCSKSAGLMWQNFEIAHENFSNFVHFPCLTI